MIVKKETKDLISNLEQVQTILNITISEYLKSYAGYGWDSFTEDLTNVSAQLHKEKIMLANAEMI